MSKLPCVVIFYHPGGEYDDAVDSLSSGIFAWNTRDYHRRKFLEAEGDYVCPDSDVPQTAKLRFWGEWEPDSYVRKLRGKSPKFLHEPFVTYPLPALPKRVHGASCGGAKAEEVSTCGGGCAGSISKAKQNTDPFVFGDSFYYTICKQISGEKAKPTSLQQLANGSIILFGSRVNKAFALDTVFVVKGGIPYQTDDIVSKLSGKVTEDYPNLMQLSRGLTLTCFVGASVSDPKDGMYSFVPCRVSDGGDVGFARPTLSADDFKSCGMGHVLSNGQQNQGKKVTPVTAEQAQKVWECVRQAVRSQGYLEGVKFRYQQKK